MVDDSEPRLATFERERPQVNINDSEVGSLQSQGSSGEAISISCQTAKSAARRTKTRHSLYWVLSCRHALQLPQSVRKAWDKALCLHRACDKALLVLRACGKALHLHRACGKALLVHRACDKAL
eukprot:scaffold150118_cov17-Tisochrysis_lutea.AAC.1